ncbi:MAG TPA: terminase small subunit [Burkholderiaceae bacterium]|nr:terminase small subunit [Burkholderiaceae bacterium]
MRNARVEGSTPSASTTNAPHDKSHPSTPSGLKPKHERFVLEYLIDGNAGKAYTRAGYSAAAGSAHVNGHRLLKNAAIQRFLQQSQQKVAAKAELSIQMVVDRLRDIAFADPRELIEHYVGCCRHCWGEGFGYQRTAGEFNREYEKWAASGKGEFDQKGGIGFDPRKPPNPDCPDCAGAGHGRTVVKDTRHLSPGARALYAGIKQTKDGIDVKTNSQVDAAEKLMRHLGGYEKDKEPVVPLVDAVREFVKGLHQSGAGRLPIAPQRKAAP